MERRARDAALMQAAVFEGDGRLTVRDIPTPDPAAGEVLVEVEACGICGSDVQIVNVPPGHPSSPPVVLGHEFVGRVRALGEGVSGFEIGTRVVVDPDPKCGACTSCRAGRPANCSNIVALGVAGITGAPLWLILVIMVICAVDAVAAYVLDGKRQ